MDGAIFGVDIRVDMVDREWIKMGAWILPPAIHRAFGGLPEGADLSIAGAGPFLWAL